MTTTLHSDTTRALTELLDITAGWLDRAGLADEAATVRALPPVVDADSLDGAGRVVQPLMQTTYRAASVLTWPQAVRGADLVQQAGGMDAELRAAEPYRHGDQVGELVRQLCGWAHTVACYAAHATTREDL